MLADKVCRMEEIVADLSKRLGHALKCRLINFGLLEIKRSKINFRNFVMIRIY